MILRAITFAAVMISALTLFGADDPLVGTWRMNLELTYTPGPKPTFPEVIRFDLKDGILSMAVTRTGNKDDVQITSHRAEYDGKPQRVTAPTQVDARKYVDQVVLKRLDSHTTTVTWLYDGKPVRTATRQVSKDGKTLTITATGPEGGGGPQFKTVQVYERQ